MRWAMRIFGVLNICASVFSLWYFGWIIDIHLGNWPGNPTRYDWAVFLALSALSTFLTLYLAYLGVRLIKRDYKALLLVIVVFTSEIVVCLVSFLLTWIVAPISSKVKWFLDMAVSPLEPQVWFGYAFIGLIAASAVIIVRRRSSVTI
jgi:hypothetical protein